MFVFGLIFFNLVGCATITRGTRSVVTINVTTPDAAITTTTGHQCNQSPCTIDVARKDKFSVTAKRDVYKDSTVHVTTKIAGAGGVAGNVIFGRVIGARVDVVSCESLEHVPNPVNIYMAHIDPTNPRIPAFTAPVAPAPQPSSTPVS